MALYTNSGLPGAGKTEQLTYLALKHYKRTNNVIVRLIRKYLKKEEYINNVYTNYPILLDKKHNIYSNRVMVSDLNLDYSFPKNSFIGIDEPQLEDDSLDFEYFDRRKAMFMQLHRHFGISNIVFSTQHPNRLIVFEKNIMAFYKRITNSFKIPFLPYKILIIRKCYELADYDFIMSRNKEKRKEHDIKISIGIININKVHSSYDDKYFKTLIIDKPLIDKGTYTSLNMDNEALKFYKNKINEYKGIYENKMSKKLKNVNQKTTASGFGTSQATAINQYNFFQKK